MKIRELVSKLEARIKKLESELEGNNFDLDILMKKYESEYGMKDLVMQLMVKNRLRMSSVDLQRLVSGKGRDWKSTKRVMKKAGMWCKMESKRGNWVWYWSEEAAKEYGYEVTKRFNPSGDG